MSEPDSIEPLRKWWNECSVGAVAAPTDAIREALADYDRLRTENARLVARNDTLENAQAACLGERDTLHGELNKVTRERDAALALTNINTEASLVKCLSRLREAERLLGETVIGKPFDTLDCVNWCSRRDAFLNHTTTKESSK